MAAQGWNSDDSSGVNAFNDLMHAQSTKMILFHSIVLPTTPSLGGRGEYGIRVSGHVFVSSVSACEMEATQSTSWIEY